MNKIVNFDLPRDAGNFGIMTREAVDIINRMPERNKFIRGLRAWSGLSSTGLHYDRDERSYGDSKFSFLSYLNHALNGITSFSSVPLRLFTYIGICGIAISLLAAFYFFITKVCLMFGINIVTYDIAYGWTPLIILALVGISLNFLGFGIVGEYVGRIFEEVKNRPHYLLRHIAYGQKIESKKRETP
jgi:polyisoprenyl-phosphate glycosyltransferase